MQNKTLIEQQELVRYPRIASEEYSDLQCTICYKRVGDDAWMLNIDNLPEAIRVESEAGCYILAKEVFINWFNEVVSFQQSDRDVADCDGSTLLQKIQDWFNKIKAKVQVEAICN